MYEIYILIIQKSSYTLLHVLKKILSDNLFLHVYNNRLSSLHNIIVNVIVRGGGDGNNEHLLFHINLNIFLLIIKRKKKCLQFFIKITFRVSANNKLLFYISSAAFENQLYVVFKVESNNNKIFRPQEHTIFSSSLNYNNLFVFFLKQKIILQSAAVINNNNIAIEKLKQR